MRYILLSTALLFSFITLRVYSEVVPDDSTIAANEEESDGGVESNDDADNLKVIGKETPTYSEPSVSGNEYLVDSFPSVENFDQYWTSSKVENEDGGLKYEGKWTVGNSQKVIIKDDLGLILTDPAKHYGISRTLDKKFQFNTDKFILQYNVKFQQGLDCGGAYVKLLSDEEQFDAVNLNNNSPYTIMFGPDRCGVDSKVHFILRYKNPKTGVYEEKHAKQPSKNLNDYFTDKKTHLFTLVVNSDSSYSTSIDKTVISEGSLLSDLTPPINPVKRIADPEDKKPEEWDERERIPDSEAVKPEDWDETQPKKIIDSAATQPSDWLSEESSLIADPEATKPDDWDVDMDGEWEPRMIDNPACAGISGCGDWKSPEINNPLYKGTWKAPMIGNPDYKGIWEPQMIDNPDYFMDSNPFKSLNSIHTIAFELWSMTGQVIFDDIIIADDQSQVDEFTKQTWDIKQEREFITSPYFGKSVYDVMKPHLWTIAGVVAFIIAAIVYFCMPKKSVSNSSAKKTDAVQPDDERVESEEDKDEDTNEELQQEQEQEREPTKGVSEGEEVTEEEKRKTEELIATSGDIITPEDKLNPNDSPIKENVDAGDSATRQTDNYSSPTCCYYRGRSNEMTSTLQTPIMSESQEAGAGDVKEPTSKE